MIASRRVDMRFIVPASTNHALLDIFYCDITHL